MKQKYNQKAQFVPVDNTIMTECIMSKTKPIINIQ